MDSKRKGSTEFRAPFSYVLRHVRQWLRFNDQQPAASSLRLVHEILVLVLVVIHLDGVVPEFPVDGDLGQPR